MTSDTDDRCFSYLKNVGVHLDKYRYVEMNSVYFELDITALLEFVICRNVDGLLILCLHGTCIYSHVVCHLIQKTKKQKQKKHYIMVQ